MTRMIELLLYLVARYRTFRAVVPTPNYTSAMKVNEF